MNLQPCQYVKTRCEIVTTDTTVDRIYQEDAALTAHSVLETTVAIHILDIVTNMLSSSFPLYAIDIFIPPLAQTTLPVVQPASGVHNMLTTPAISSVKPGRFPPMPSLTVLSYS